ncbi:hypothetical protein MPTK1_8g09700 [Marchantia polymorpha subsp. ruderalis]|uniref:Uncharacterized protein n=1 Tax=Marchantia polymorpha TaxID=3197 RepID=A0A2R6XNA4_MARPO|nr:hypothetical protein MARPO_0008s0251 [Marchantia polymorpha]BBN19327.1 hypothetical protein Mp_8g09700 [Marchantia polymorpha subsp. ruderalis]|eukprot:PTQ47506.1 hypothetical protein MARPO_0008s0251 [Marchantia polymorpha]
MFLGVCRPNTRREYSTRKGKCKKPEAKGEKGRSRSSFGSERAGPTATRDDSQRKASIDEPSEADGRDKRRTPGRPRSRKERREGGRDGVAGPATPSLTEDSVVPTERASQRARGRADGIGFSSSRRRKEGRKEEEEEAAPSGARTERARGETMEGSLGDEDEDEGARQDKMQRQRAQEEEEEEVGGRR